MLTLSDLFWTGRRWEIRTADGFAGLDEVLEGLRGQLACVSAQRDQPNDPLEPDGLREMIGEPVWIVSLGKGAKKCRWRVLTGIKDGFFVFDNAVKSMAECGKTWAAYRRKN